jgi:hypothetical protein
MHNKVRADSHRSSICSSQVPQLARMQRAGTQTGRRAAPSATGSDPVSCVSQLRSLTALHFHVCGPRSNHGPERFKPAGGPGSAPSSPSASGIGVSASSAAALRAAASTACRSRGQGHERSRRKGVKLRLLYGCRIGA